MQNAQALLEFWGSEANLMLPQSGMSEASDSNSLHRKHDPNKPEQSCTRMLAFSSIPFF